MASQNDAFVTTPSLVPYGPKAVAHSRKAQRDRLLWESETASLLAFMEKHGKAVEIRSKRMGYKSKWHKMLTGFVVFLYAVSELFSKGDGSPMRRARRRFNEGYHTTLGDTIYWASGSTFDPGNWRHYMVLAHECVHILDRRRFGAFLFGGSYVFLLPAVLTMRALWEKRAYLEELRLMNYFGLHDRAHERGVSVEKQFRGSAYMLMEPFFGGGFGPNGEVLRKYRRGEVAFDGGVLHKAGHRLAKSASTV